MTEENAGEYNDDNIDLMAQKIVDDMDLGDLLAYVKDDLVSLMEKDEEMFHINKDLGHAPWQIEKK